MKKTNNNLGKFLKGTSKSPFSYFGGFLFAYFLAVIVFIISISDYAILPIKFIVDPFWIYFELFSIPLLLILLLIFTVGAVLFHGLKKKFDWAWFIYFFILPLKIVFITLAGLDWLFYILYDCNRCGSTDCIFQCQEAKEMPFLVVNIFLIAIALYGFYFYLISQKENFNIKVKWPVVIFWIFNISFIVFLIYSINYIISYKPPSYIGFIF